MAVNVTDRDEIVRKTVREISHIATLPEITLKIIELVEDPSSTAQDLHKVIQHDPALCTRILKVVNSSFYGLPGQIGSINRAIVLLGLNAVKNIAISASLAKLFRGGQLSPSFSARELWMHSIGTATACKELCDVLKLGVPDEAFLAGLMHDIGVMVEMQADRHKLIDVVNEVQPNAKNPPQADMMEVEQRVFGATHQDFGKGLCEKWKFPQAFMHVAGNHHTPLELPSGSRTLASIVYIADRIVAEVDNGYRMDLQSLEINPSVMDEVKITHEQLDSIRTRLPEQITEVESTLTGS